MRNLARYMITVLCVFCICGCSSHPAIKVKDFIKEYGEDAFVDFYEPSCYFGGSDRMKLSEMDDSVLHYEGYDSPTEAYTYVCRQALPGTNSLYDFDVTVYSEEAFCLDEIYEVGKMEHTVEDGVEFYVDRNTYITYADIGNHWMMIRFGTSIVLPNDSGKEIIDIEKRLSLDALELNK